MTTSVSLNVRTSYEQGKGVKRAMSDGEDEEEFACDLCEEIFDRDSMRDVRFGWH